MRPREAVFDAVRKKITSKTWLVVHTETEHEKCWFSASCVRAKVSRGYIIKEIKPRLCRLTYTSRVDVGGKVSSGAMNATLKKDLLFVFKTQTFFQNLKKLEDWGEADGSAVGLQLIALEKGSKAAHVRATFRENAGLKEVGGKLAFFEGMVQAVIENKLRPAKVVKTRLADLSLQDGRKIGQSLAASIASNLTADAAVDEWVVKYPGLRELEAEYVPGGGGGEGRGGRKQTQTRSLFT
jgi:hypothetical protein